MEKSEILSRLKTFEANLADKEIESKDRAEVIYNAWEAFEFYDKKIRRDSIGVYEYDKEAYQKIELGQEQLHKDFIKARNTVVEFTSERQINSNKIVALQKFLTDELPGRLEGYKTEIANYDTWLTRELSAEERRRVEANKAEFVAKYNENNDSEEVTKKKIEDLKKENEKLTASIKEQEDLATRLSSEYSENEKKLDEIKVVTKLTPEQIYQAQYEANLLYTRYKFLEMDPKKELSILISDYESGRITERDLTLRLSDINEVLNTVMYDLNGVTILATPEAVLARREEIKKNIAELERKIEDKSNYRKENKDAENRLWGYNYILANFEPERKDITAQIRTKKSEVKEWEDNLASATSTEGKNKAKDVLDRKEKELKALELKLENSKKREEDTKARILEVNEDFLDRDARAKDIALLAEQNALLASTYSEEAQVRRSFISEFDGFARELKSGKNLRGDDQMYPFLRQLTPEDRAHAENVYKEFSIAPSKPERQNPPFWDDLTQNQKDAYFDYIDGHTPEEIEEFNNGVAEALAAEKAEAARLAKEAFEKENNIVTTPGDTVKEGERLMNVPQPEPAPIVPPVPSDPPVPPVPEPIKVKTWKELGKEIQDRIKKDWENGKLKKALLIAGAAVLVIAMGSGIYSCASQNNSNPTPTPTPPAATGTLTPSPTPDPTHKPSNTDKPEVTTPVIPTPIPTPTPTTGVINLETAAPAGTGNSAPADATDPYLDGNAVRETKTNTYVDSNGTKITYNADGTSTVQPNSQTVTANPDGTVSVPENLDMSAIPTPTPAPATSQAPMTTEEALAAGVITPTEAGLAQLDLEAMFNGR